MKTESSLRSGIGSVILEVSVSNSGVVAATASIFLARD